MSEDQDRSGDANALGATYQPQPPTAVPPAPAVTATGPPASAAVAGGITDRLRDLASARDHGLISEEEFVAAKAKVLTGAGLAASAAPTGSGASDPHSNGMLAGWSLLAAAIALTVAYFFSWSDYDGFFAIQDEPWKSSEFFAFGMCVVSLAIGAGITLRARRLNAWTLGAVPVAIAYLALVPGVATYGLDAFGAWAVPYYAVAVALAVAAIAIGRRAAGWEAIARNPVALTVGAVAALSGTIAFFTDAFRYESFSVDTLGARWQGSGGWGIIVSVVSLAAVVAFPLLAAVLADATAGTLLAAGSALALLSIYWVLIWEALTGELSFTASVAWLVIAFGAAVALALHRLLRPSEATPSPPYPPAATGAF